MNEIENAIKYIEDKLKVVAYEEGKIPKALLLIRNILEKQLNNGWISVNERLPEYENLLVETKPCGSYRKIKEKAPTNWKSKEKELERNCDNCKHFNGEILISKASVHCLRCENFGNWKSKELEQKIAKVCENCKHYNDLFDCSQCKNLDEWKEWKEWEEKEDLIHCPSHYTYSEHEPIDVIKAWCLDFDLGNVVKYIARCEHKGNKIQDLNKALEYLQHEIKSLEVKSGQDL